MVNLLGRFRKFTRLSDESISSAMVDVDLDVTGLDQEQAATRLNELLGAIDADAVVRIRALGQSASTGVLSAAAVRALAPSTMTVTLSWPRSAR